MNNLETFEKFVISQKALLIRDDKALIMNMTKFPDAWDLPGGRIDVGENAKDAFRREIKEEMGIDDFKSHGMVDVEIWRTPKAVPVCGTLCLIENEKDEIVISDEHIKFAWVEEEELEQYKFFWPFFPRMIKRGFEYRKMIDNLNK